MKPFQRRLPSRAHFIRRLATSALVAALLIGGSLGIGILGYHFCVGLGWLDALLNSSMILTGMGPVDPVRTPGGKIFASAFALFSGVAFLTIVAVLLAPVVQRFLHRFHLELWRDESDRDA